jgi:OmpA-OmpF porin, OOP family
VDALVKSYGIPAARMTAVGVGPATPLASNDSEEGQAKNRRVELVKM